MANELHGTYDFAKVALIVGTRQISGFESGTEITFERDEMSFSKKVDVDGSVTRARTNNNAGKATFTLTQYSPSNKYLQNLLNIDERTGAGVFPVKCVDRQNPMLELAIALRAWIQNPPIVFSTHPVCPYHQGKILISLFQMHHRQFCQDTK